MELKVTYLNLSRPMFLNTVGDGGVISLLDLVVVLPTTV